jgi:hypothetical protein
MVHFHTDEGVRPAVITAVKDDGTVHLQVIVDIDDAILFAQTAGTVARRDVTEGTAIGQWAWPPRV